MKVFENDVEPVLATRASASRNQPEVAYNSNKTEKLILDKHNRLTSENEDEDDFYSNFQGGGSR